jgi:ADP-heptose:LPS heptosyltransferase
VLPPEEFDEWTERLREGFPHHSFKSLDGLARFLCEARLFIGNDSGPGHLASAVGTPTVTVAARASQAQRWRPCWSPGEVVSPLLQFPGTSLQFATWRALTSVGRTVRAVERLLARTR